MMDVELHTIKGTYINCTAHAILKYSPSIYCFCCGLWFIIGLEKLINGGGGGPIKLLGGGYWKINKRGCTFIWHLRVINLSVFFCLLLFPFKVCVLYGYVSHESVDYSGSDKIKWQSYFIFLRTKSQLRAVVWRSQGLWIIFRMMR